MAGNVTYNGENLTITVDGAEEVSQALGDLKNKTPAAIKVAINATAREARKLMIAKAKARYAVNSAGQKHLKELVQKKRASNTSLWATLHIASMRNDLAYFKYSPKGVYSGPAAIARAGNVTKGKVLKSSPMKPLTGSVRLSKGFVLEFKSGHIGMVQRIEGSDIGEKKTVKSGKPRWKTHGRVEKLMTMGSPSASAMHSTIWPDVEPKVEEYLAKRLDEQVEKVLARAGRI